MQIKIIAYTPFVMGTKLWEMRQVALKFYYHALPHREVKNYRYYNGVSSLPNHSYRAVGRIFT